MTESQTAQVTLAGENLTLRYGWGAFTALADALGCTVNNIDAVVADLPVSALDTVLWAGLRTHHSALSLDDVKRMLDTGAIREAKAAVGKAGELFRASMNDAKEAGDDAAAGPPSGGKAKK